MTERTLYRKKIKKDAIKKIMSNHTKTYAVQPVNTNP